MNGTGHWHERAFRTDVPRKIALSLGVGGLAYFITNVVADASEALQIWSITISVFIGGVVLITQLLGDFEKRLAKVELGQERHAREIEQRVKTGFSTINEATKLFGLVEDSALATEGLIQLVRHSTQIDAAAPPLVFRFAQAEISRMSEFLKELGDGGNVIYEGEDRDWMLSLTRTVETSIDATSLTTVDAGGDGFVDGGLWSSDLGQRYLDCQRDAIQRGVHIRRVFILDKPDLADEDFLGVCRLQREIGIHVRILDSSAIPGLRRSSLFDFILFDEGISYEVTPASRVEGAIAPSILTTRLELRPARVRDRMQRFKDLWESARDLD
ncbi:phosphatidylserine/phosphatidylglycerophosphate/cardiolipin synthase family protein [Planosporangium mesophilum]|uniref:Phosphatidylserine/phosphatidylglycerophosphate/ cardiolipin synthase family protein n=1 Tax=Planosporangium mesophilum TaxID=689768 RepID=A0A8J3X5V3_9ACTN|nr:phosphatidylserine/phosphatidylglycerophosphate/cardiolipin synthase family protein [Planosporangium mesophilum]NJC86409.1 phosphatidylserine/phosphatidylglycerophosphate/cardiolipin synthase family protein [Planosporangium mesophilum]GII25113.1 hypothetical protein Pme01_47100 [Planosporangium mesophilum]